MRDRSDDPLHLEWMFYHGAIHLAPTVQSPTLNVTWLPKHMVWWIVRSNPHGGPIDLFLIPASAVLSV